MRVATWNTKWAPATSDLGREVQRQIVSVGAEVFCATEAYGTILPSGGYLEASDADYGYRDTRDRRKVILWSERPWTNVSRHASSGLPSGRIVQAETITSLGSLAVVGVCVPWRQAHVSTGRKDRKPWQDHLAFLAALTAILEAAPRPLIVLGDFNQRIPAARQLPAAAGMLSQALAGLAVASAGLVPGLEEPSIDHIVHSPDLVATSVSGYWPSTASGTRLSDHPLVMAGIEPRGGRCQPNRPGLD